MNSGVLISSPAARAVEQPSVSGARLWSGRILAALVALFLLLHGTAKVMKGSALLAASLRLGLSESLVATGVARLLSTSLDMIPRTSIPVAIRLSGCLGGAAAIQPRVGNPLFCRTLLPVYFGVLVWLGRYCPSSLARAGSFAKLI